MALHLLLGLLATLLLAIPGAAVAIAWRPDDDGAPDPLAHLLVALGWSCGLVPFAAFAFVALTRAPLTVGVLASAAAVVTAAALAWTALVHRRRGAAAWLPVQLRRGWRPAAPVLLAAAAIGALYLVQYDRSAFSEQSCFYRLVVDTLSLSGETTDGRPVDLLRSEQDDQRLGNTAVLSAFVRLYGSVGFRLLYALMGVAMALGGFELGRRGLAWTGAGRAWGWFALLALPLNPYVLGIPLLDENLLTLGFSSLFLPLLLRRRAPWAHLGALIGLAWMMRHVAVLSLPAVGWALLHTDGHRGRAAVRWLLPFAAVTALGHVHHHLAYGSVFTFESLGQFDPVPHRWLGDYGGLLQWPFAESAVRTPWNPLPMALLWPIAVARELGVVACGALLIGAVALAIRDRRQAVLWLLWFAPPYLALSLQENWDVPNKMGVIVILFHPLVVWTAAGIAAALRRPRRWGVAWLAAALAVAAAMLAARAVDVPADERYAIVWPGERAEDPAYVRAARQRVTTPLPWPAYGRVRAHAPPRPGRQLRALVEQLREPSLTRPGAPYGWFPGERTDPDGAPVTIELDLSERLFDRPTGWARVTASDTPPTVDLTADGPPVVIRDVALGWAASPATVVLSAGGAQVTSVLLLFEPFEPAAGEPFDDRWDRALMLLTGTGTDALRGARELDAPDGPLRLRVPPGPLAVHEVVNNAGHRYLHWQAWVTPGEELALRGPALVFHN